MEDKKMRINDAVYFLFKNGEFRMVSVETWENSWLEWWNSIQEIS